MFSLSAEFPNDNPLLHRGVRWVCLEPTGHPIAEHPDPEIEEHDVPAPAVIEELPKLAAAVESIARAVDDLVAAALEVNVAPEVATTTLETVSEAVLGPSSAIVALAPPMAFEVEMMMDIVEATPTTVEAPSPSFEVEEATPAEARPSGIVLKEERPDDAALDDEPEEIVVEELEPVTVVCVEGVGEPIEEIVAEEERVVASTEVPPAPDDPFTMLVCTLADVALTSGSAVVASLLPGLLHEAKLDLAALPDGAMTALREANIVDDGGVTESFRTTVAAWKALLRGTSDDFMACGGSMLDEWSSDLLARLVGSMDRAPAMRRDLRSRGVAAFGLAA